MVKVTISDEDLGGLMYVKLAEGEIAGTKEVAPGVILDYTEDKQIVGIEILYLDKTGERRADDLTLKAFVEPNVGEGEKKAG